MKGGGGAPSGGGASGAGPRERILGRIRAALESRHPVDHPGVFPGELPSPGARGVDLVEAFTRALHENGGEAVVLASPEHAREWLRGLAMGWSGAAVSPDVPSALRPGLPDATPDFADVGVSLAMAASATTGSLVLSSREGRALQLLPPVHVVWVPATSVCATLGEALSRARLQGALPATLAIHSGPSKSADIGRILVTGVHGPGRLVAAVATFPLPEGRSS